MTEFDYPEVTLCSWQDIIIQSQTNSVVYLYYMCEHPFFTLLCTFAVASTLFSLSCLLIDVTTLSHCGRHHPQFSEILVCEESAIRCSWHTRLLLFECMFTDLRDHPFLTVLGVDSCDQLFLTMCWQMWPPFVTVLCVDRCAHPFLTVVCFVQAVLADVTTLQVVPLLQLALFSKWWTTPGSLDTRLQRSSKWHGQHPTQWTPDTKIINHLQVKWTIPDFIGSISK